MLDPLMLDPLMLDPLMLDPLILDPLMLDPLMLDPQMLRLCLGLLSLCHSCLEGTAPFTKLRVVALVA